ICIFILLLIFSYAVGGKVCSDSLSVGSQGDGSRAAMQRPLQMFNTVENWICEEEYIWRELGEQYYPRYVREVKCLNTTCMYGYYTCSPVYINVKVLTFNNFGCFDLNLPYELRPSWVFQDIAVAAHCHCSKVE
ncbi:hypothetical protein CHS0354_024353, partial [Potamilus streckersoni]